MEFRAPIGKMSRHHEAIATVVAFAAADHDSAVDAERLQNLSSATPRVFHEHRPGNAKMFDGVFVKRADLFAR
jgi:hypothetical protein